MGDFSIQLAAFAARAKANANAVVRKVVLDIGTRLVERSPVGDRELWAVNQPNVMNRELYQDFRAEQGKRPASRKTLDKYFGLRPEGYVGGRFRANWQLSEHARVPGELYQESPPASSYPDPGQILAAADANITLNPAGKKFYWQNNLPYAQALEDGWSTQAPAGMVGLTVSEFQSIVNGAAQEVSK